MREGRQSSHGGAVLSRPPCERAWLLAFLLALPMIQGWGVTGTEVQRSTYAISGRSHAELKQSVRRNAPRGGTAYGIGFIDFHPRYGTAMKDGSCRISTAEVGLRVVLKVPEWKGEAGAPRAVIRLARHFARTIDAHEMQHVAIAMRFQREMRARLLKLPAAPNCWTVRGAAADLILTLKKRHIESQKAFDRRTHKQIRRLL